MAVFDEKSIQNLFDSNLRKAKECLASLAFCCSASPSFGGLTGWVFEETIHHCLAKELSFLGTQAKIGSQEALEGRSKVDLVVGQRVAAEIKEKGLFDRNAADRYGRYMRSARTKGYSYLYLTREETYQPYREAIKKAVGRRNAFFLDRPGEWARFVQQIVKELRSPKKSPIDNKKPRT